MMSATTDISNKGEPSAKNGGISETAEAETRESVTGTLENGNESDNLELIEQDSFELGNNDDIDNNSDVWKVSDSEDETSNLEKTEHEQQKDPEVNDTETDIVEPESEQTLNGADNETIDNTHENSGLESPNTISEVEKSTDKQEAKIDTAEESAKDKDQGTEESVDKEAAEESAKDKDQGTEESVDNETAEESPKDKGHGAEEAEKSSKDNEDVEGSPEEEKPSGDGSNQKEDALIDGNSNKGEEEKDKPVEESSEKVGPDSGNDATEKKCEDVQIIGDDDEDKDKVNEDSSKDKDGNNVNEDGSVAENGTQDTTGDHQDKEIPMETEDADLDDSEDFDAFDPSLLCPEVYMAVDESPVVTTAENGPNGSDSPLPYDEMYSSYVDEVTGAEIDIKLTQEEQDIRKRMYSVTNPVQYTRIHCTACNLHLGSALETQNNRFVHPMLKVIICKKCYNFYTSGEFEKDEDGSELYCRWCGQGGQVLCCSKCEYVFCKKCIRTNCGKKKLTEIKDSDEWNCFRCNPDQIKLLKVTCAEFFDYVRRERTRASTLNDPEFMKIDYCRCCQRSAPQKRPLEEGVENKKPKPKKRKGPVDETYDPLKSLGVQKTPKQKPLPALPGSVSLNTIPNVGRMILPKPGVAGPVRPTPQTLPHLVINPMQPNTVRTSMPNAMRPNMPNAMRPPMPNSMRTTMPRYQFVASNQNQMRPTIQAPALVRIGAPIVRQPPPLTGPGNRGQGLLQDRLTQGNKPPGTMKHEWFEKTIRASARVTAHLSYTLTQLNKSQSQAASVEELAVVHNKLQEILSSSINSLIQVRKNLRTEFINGIKTVRFPPKPIPAQPKFASTPVTSQDDDVIFVPSAPPPVIVLDPTPSTSRSILEPRPSTSLIPLSKPTPKVVTPTTNSNAPRGPYLKVKSFTQLQSVTADCIILPDDPEPPQPEKDPLAIEVEDRTEKEVTCNGSAVETVNISKEKEKEKKEKKKEKGKDTRTGTESVMDEPMNQNSVYNVENIPTTEVKRMMSAVVKVKKDDLKKLQEEFSKKCQEVV